MKRIEQVLSSMEVAAMVEKGHKELLRDIRRYIGQLGQSKIAPSDFFQESTYKNSQNKTQPCYNITKKGCEFIAHKLTGVKGTAFTARYINRFHEMEEIIENREQPQGNRSCTPTQKLYKGQPVAIIQDISRITGFSKGAIRHVINKNCSVFDYKVLKGTELLHFKSENHLQKRLHSLIIIFESGVKKLAKIYRFQPTDLFDSPKLPTVPVREYPPQKLSFMDELKMKSFIMNDLGMSKSIKLNYYYDTFRKFGIDIQFLKNIGAEVRIQQSALELGETIVKDLTKEEALELIEDLKNNPEFTATSQLAQDYTIEFINKAIMLKEVV